MTTFHDKDGDTLEIRTASANTANARLLIIAHQSQLLGGEVREARLVFSDAEAIRLRDYLIERFPLPQEERGMAVVGDIAEFPATPGITVNIASLNITVGAAQ